MSCRLQEWTDRQKLHVGQGHWVTNHCSFWKVLPQGMQIWFMKALPLLVIKLWPTLKFFICRSNFKVKVTRSIIRVRHEKVLPQGMHIWNIKALPLFVTSYGRGSSFSKGGQTSRSRSLGHKSLYGMKGLATRNAHMKSLPLLVMKLWPRLKLVRTSLNYGVQRTSCAANFLWNDHSLYAPITLDEYQAWFHLYGTSRPTRSTSKVTKYKIFAHSGTQTHTLRLVAWCSTNWATRA